MAVSSAWHTYCDTHFHKAAGPRVLVDIDNDVGRRCALHSTVLNVHSASQHRSHLQSAAAVFGAPNDTSTTFKCSVQTLVLCPALYESTVCFLMQSAGLQTLQEVLTLLYVSAWISMWSASHSGHSSVIMTVTLL